MAVTELDNLIEVLQGVREGRKWGIRFHSSGELIEQMNQDIDSLGRLLSASDVERIELMPLPDEIEFNGVIITAPLRVAPQKHATYYVAMPSMPDCYRPLVSWDDSPLELEWLSRGLLHLTAEAASKHGRAMCLEQK